MAGFVSTNAHMNRYADMLTPLHLAGLILWAPIDQASNYKPFIMWTEQYAPYCPIEYGALYE